MNKRVLFIITEDWALISHRLHLVDEAISKGFVVGLVTRVTDYNDFLEKRGVKIFKWQLNRKSLNPIKEFVSVLDLYKTFRTFKPDIVHAVAQKPIIYSGLVKIFFPNIGFVATLGGLGFVFSNKNLKAKLLKSVVKIFLKFVLVGNRTRLIIQNKDNLHTIMNSNILKKQHIRLIKGAGVEIKKFLPTPSPKGLPIVILPARMLRDKGVLEFVKVAQIINSKRKKALFVLVGDIDKHNPVSLSQECIDKWVNSKIVEHWGRRDDMEIIYSKSSIVCLPSYHEGLPKVLIEAGSCSRPTVAFNVPGCRDVIKHGVNGFLVDFGDIKGLEKAIIDLIINRKLRQKMGKEARKLVETYFSSSIINSQTFQIWDEVT